MVDLDSDYSADERVVSDSDGDDVVPTLEFAPKGTSSGNSFGYLFMHIFCHASFAKFGEVNQNKNVVVDKHVKLFDLKRVGV